jgi:hypothetical protein
MSVQVSEVSSPIQITRWRLVERTAFEGGQLSIRVRAMPENLAWDVRFSSVIAFRLADERDMLKFGTACAAGVLFKVHAGGWLSEAAEILDVAKTGFYGEAQEFFVAGDDTCVNILCNEYPEVSACIS